MDSAAPQPGTRCSSLKCRGNAKLVRLLKHVLNNSLHRTEEAGATRQPVWIGHLDRSFGTGRPESWGRGLNASRVSARRPPLTARYKRRGPDRWSGPLLDYQVSSERSGDILAAAAKRGHAEEASAQKQH